MNEQIQNVSATTETTTTTTDAANPRRSAKTVNFGLIYGMSESGLARYLSIKRSNRNPNTTPTK